MYLLESNGIITFLYKGNVEGSGLVVGWFFTSGWILFYLRDKMSQHTRGRGSSKRRNNYSVNTSQNLGGKSDMGQISQVIQSRNPGPEDGSRYGLGCVPENIVSHSSIYNTQQRERISTVNSVNIMLPRLSPAKIQQKVIIKTNVYPLEITDRIIYRYDVVIEACSERPHTANAARVDLRRGRQDPYRAKKCMRLIDMALQRYQQLREFAYAYDSSSTLFTNQSLDLKEVSEITMSSNNFQELREMFGSSVTISIKINECREFAHTFHTTDFGSSITSNILAQDHSLRQFYEILTNQHGLRSGLYFSFGFGRLYKEKSDNIKLKDGIKLLMGADKSIRFIEGNQSTGLVPALVLDGKKTPFYIEETLKNFAAEIYRPGVPNPSIPYLNGKEFECFMRYVGPTIKNLRLLRANNTKTFVASGLSTRPVKDLRNGRMSLIEAYERLGINIRPDLPAVVLNSRFGSTFFPLEVLRVSPIQKVPNSKLQANQKQAIMKNAVIPPKLRHKEIERHMEALNLSGSKFNPILAAFGVRISKNPMEVEANRRMPPQIYYNPKCILNVEPNKASWNSGNNQFAAPAKIDNFHLFYDEECDEKAMTNFFHSICNAAMKRGINFKAKLKKKVCLNELEANIKKINMEFSGKTNFLMYVGNQQRAHDQLKLYEAFYQVITQHVKYSTVTDKTNSLENIVNKMNVKNFGHNYRTVPENYAIKRWLSSGNTLVIGYDVCHPEAQSAVERRLNIIFTQPSVIGFSFNAAKDPETFIGDYAFHEPKQEQVTSYILECRIFHILKLFHEMRRNLPTLIVITRDGVSEGQYKMVMVDELEAIRSGIQNYADFSKQKEYKPKIVLLIVVKRHNKRFFIEREKGIIENCSPGTVIDHTVTRVDATEIFMQSHKVIKGTGKMPAYTLLVNEANMKMDELQAFINALCYNHQIITSAVSLPEPVFQADEWAKRGRNNFRAMYENKFDKLPRKRNGKVDWDERSAFQNDMKLCILPEKTNQINAKYCGQYSFYATIIIYLLNGNRKRAVIETCFCADSVDEEESKELDISLLSSLSAIKINCIPRILAGNDVLGCAKTGTGKTLAFALPILHELTLDPYGICALVLTPTRELAIQIGDQFAALGAPVNLKIGIIVGGKDRVAQGNGLTRRPHIVVATPGRLADHLESDSENTRKLFEKLRFLVLDEADRLLDGQYSVELKTILNLMPKQRQTLLFSATITSALSQLHQVAVKKPYFFEDKSEIATVDKLEQKYVLTPCAVKDAYLVYVVKNFHEKYPDSLILIFSHTCRECQALAIMFHGLGFQVGSLHSQISQQERMSSLTKFRSGHIKILICTDVASRGLDIPHVNLVVNHNVPQNPKTYIHRVGRSARAGRFGCALIFVTQYDIFLLQEIEKIIRKKLDKLVVNDKKVTQYVTQVLVTKREAEIKLDQQNFGERKTINKRKEMLIAGLDPDEVERTLKMQREQRKQAGKKRREQLDKIINKQKLKKERKKVKITK
ncbi:putative ATP-dependent RNA helicase [Dirofilaria immitis]